MSSSISRPDGTRLIDDGASAKVGDVKQTFYGVDSEGGVEYLTRVEPILDDRNQVIASRWFGVPLETFTAIQQHTLVSLMLWGLVGILIGLAIAVPVVQRIARSLAARSRQVRASAQELSVVIVGSEVSGDHVAQTRAAVERQGELLMQAATEGEAQSNERRCDELAASRRDARGRGGEDPRGVGAQRGDPRRRHRDRYARIGDGVAHAASRRARRRAERSRGRPRRARERFQVRRDG